MIHKLFCILFFILFSSVINANQLGLPRGCEAIGFEFKDNNIILNQLNEQSIYFIQNISQSIIYLLHQEKTQVFMSLSWQAKLNKNLWATLALNEANMNFNCNKITKGQISIVNCTDVIRVCQYPRVKFTLSNQGTYWISKNKKLRQSMSKAIKKGILLSW